jgi:hypothetical protein
MAFEQMSGDREEAEKAGFSSTIQLLALPAAALSPWRQNHDKG